MAGRKRDWKPGEQEAVQEVIGQLRELRKRGRQTQGEVARLVGIGQSYLSELENGCHLEVSLAMIARLARGLGYDFKVTLSKRTEG
jgi:transcriptional regulator with XRE-family HTH domain